MRKAHSQGLKKKIALQFVKNLLKRQFAGIHIAGNLEALQSNDEPTLYLANHISLWDFSVASFLTHSVFHQDSFVMAAEYTMLPVAPWAGAYSVNAVDSYEIAQSIRYSVDLLRNVPRCGLWMFPQGMVSPYGQYPLNFKAGAALIALQVRQLRLIPVVINYSFLNHVQPEAFVTFGDAFTIGDIKDSKKIIKYFEDRVQEKLNWVNQVLGQAHTKEFVTVFHGRPDLRYFAFKVLKKPYPPLKQWGRWY